MKSVFVSHSTHDRAFVESELIPFLESLGVQPWYSKHAITTASEWERSIRAALGKCDWILVVLSPASVSSDWVRAEVHWALEHKPGRVIPVLLSACDPAELHIKLAGIQFSDFQTDRTTGFANLSDLLGRPVATIEKPRARPRIPKWIAFVGVLGVLAVLSVAANFIGPVIMATLFPPTLPARADRDGVVDQVHVKVGDQVRRRQILASLRRQFTDQDLEKMKKSVDDCVLESRNKAIELHLAQEQLARLQNAGPGAVPEKRIHDAKATLAEAEQAVAKANRAIGKAAEAHSAAEWNVMRRNVECPWDGEVTEIRRSAGDVVRDGETILIIRPK